MGILQEHETFSLGENTLHEVILITPSLFFAGFIKIDVQHASIENTTNSIVINEQDHVTSSRHTCI